jgi:hypothetical protein
MKESDIIKRMEDINKISALFDWLNLIDGHTVGGTYEDILASTCVLTIEKPDDDIMKALGLG